MAIGVAASLELRMDLMDVVLELSRTWLAGDRLGERFYTSLARSVPKLRDLSLAERTECDATVMSVGEVSGPSAYARVADDVVRQALKRQTHRRLGALAGGAAVYAGPPRCRSCGQVHCDGCWGFWKACAES